MPSLLGYKLLSLAPSMKRLIQICVIVLLLTSLMANVAYAISIEPKKWETVIDYENEPAEEETNTPSKADTEEQNDDDSKLIASICQPGSIIRMSGNFSNLSFFWPGNHTEIINPPPQVIA